MNQSFLLFRVTMKALFQERLVLTLIENRSETVLESPLQSPSY